MASENSAFFKHYYTSNIEYIYLHSYYNVATADFCVVDISYIPYRNQNREVMQENTKTKLYD